MRLRCCHIGFIDPDELDQDFSIVRMLGSSERCSGMHFLVAGRCPEQPHCAVISAGVCLATQGLLLFWGVRCIGGHVVAKENAFLDASSGLYSKRVIAVADAKLFRKYPVDCCSAWCCSESVDCNVFGNAFGVVIFVHHIG